MKDDIFEMIKYADFKSRFIDESGFYYTNHTYLIMRGSVTINYHTAGSTLTATPDLTVTSWKAVLVTNDMSEPVDIGTYDILEEAFRACWEHHKLCI